MRTFIGLAVMTVTLAACDTPSSPTGPSRAPLTDAELTATLTRALQDEFRAEAIYQGVLDDFGPVQPFANVLGAEERHSAALARLFVLRGLPVPASTSTAATVAHFASVPAACAAGVTAERDNVAMYDELLRADLPADVRQVFSNNRSASLANHLPAFTRCS